MAFKVDELMIQVAPGKPQGMRNAPHQEEDSDCHDDTACQCDTGGPCEDQSCRKEDTLVGTYTAHQAGLDLLRRQMKERLSQDLPV